jgi:hypothetical protein
VLDPATGEIASERFPAKRGRLRAWAERWADRLEAVAIEATTGWRWVARALQALGLEMRLADPGRASALQVRRKQAMELPHFRGQVGPGVGRGLDPGRRALIKRWLAGTHHFPLLMPRFAGRSGEADSRVSTDLLLTPC